MSLDIINFAKKLLSSCIPVNVEYFKMYKLNSIEYDKDSDFNSMINHYLLKCIFLM